jgi:hypothetical protein
MRGGRTPQANECKESRTVKKMSMGEGFGDLDRVGEICKGSIVFQKVVHSAIRAAAGIETALALHRARSGWR